MYELVECLPPTCICDPMTCSSFCQKKAIGMKRTFSGAGYSFVGFECKTYANLATEEGKLDSLRFYAACNTTK